MLIWCTMRGSVISKLPAPIAVVCHDAGAANLILSWLRAEENIVVQAYMQGPAEALWCKVFPKRSLKNSVNEALAGVKTLITGTGWASKLEHEARVIASLHNIYSVAVLDHWVNYLSRFERDGKMQLPDKLLVADNYALMMAQKVFPGVSVCQLDNLYLNDQVARVGAAPGNGTILVLLEPVRNNWGRNREGEFQALNYFFDNLESLGMSSISKIVLRPHPSENFSKYQSWLSHFHPMVSMDDSKDVAAAISLADVVVGVESFALTIALAAGRPTFSSLPPWAPPLRLPHIGIKQIRYM